MKLKGSCHCQAVKFSVESETPYPFMYCYCSICRKTAGGPGSAINIMGLAKTLKVQGKQHVKIYHAILGKKRNGTVNISNGKRHFCKRCGSCLWISDSNWPDLVHPFASAIDSKLPSPRELIHIMTQYAANWVPIPKGKGNVHFEKYPQESILEWHQRHHLVKKK